MKAFLLCTRSHRELIAKHLLPSLPDDLDLVIRQGRQHCGTGEYMKAGWLECMRENGKGVRTKYLQKGGFWWKGMGKGSGRNICRKAVFGICRVLGPSANIGKGVRTKYLQKGGFWWKGVRTKYLQKGGFWHLPRPGPLRKYREAASLIGGEAKGTGTGRRA